MFCCHQNTRFIVRSLNILNYCTITGKKHLLSSGKIKFFSNIFELQNPKAIKQILEKNECLLEADQQDVLESFNFLTNNGITVNDIRNLPSILCLKEITLRNRHEIFSECGGSNVNVFTLSRYSTITNHTEKALKLMGILHNEINVQKRLADILNIELYPCKKDLPLTMIRLHVLQLFYSQNDVMTSEQFYDAMKRFPCVKHKSFRTIKASTKLFVDESQIPKERILEYFRMLQSDPDNVREVLSLKPIEGDNVEEVLRLTPYRNILHSDPDNVRKLLTMKPIGGVDIRDIIKKTPNILSTPYESIQDTLRHIKKFGFAEEAITKCFSVLTLDSRIVRDRLKEINSKKDLLSMKFHPNILRLIFYQIRANDRLNHLNRLEKKCFSLSLLTGNVEPFRRYSVDESDKYNWRTCVLFLATTFKEDQKDVKREISRHPYWLYVPISDMKQTIDTLLHAEFTLKDIYLNIHVVLYTRELILNRIKKLNETQQINGCKVRDIPKYLQLKLVLYQIEAEFHFTGDAVWMDRKSNFSLD